MGFLFAMAIFLAVAQNVSAQLVGSPSSGQSAVQYCAPNAQYVVRYQYEVSFGVMPQGWFRMVFRLETQSGTLVSSANYFNDGTRNQITIAQDINPPHNWLITRNHTFTLPPNNDCEYTAKIWFYEDPEMDGTYSVVDLTQLQYLANWHTDDQGDGFIDVAPAIHEVCERDGLAGFQFADASRFACTSATLPPLSKPNYYERHVQFVYGTSANPVRGIPNLTINVHGTPVQLTDATGAPMPNHWNVNPLNGAIVPWYSTASGFFEGPVISTGQNATGGSQLTFPISYPAGLTKVNDYFEVTVRNWNFCNPWNGSQTNPNAADARTDVGRILVLGAPPAPGVQDATICYGSGASRTLRATTSPVGRFYWYSDPGLTTQVASGTNNYTPPHTAVGTYDYYVVDRGLTGLMCTSVPSKVTLTIYPVITNNNISDDQTICYNTAPAQLTGPQPTGGDGVTYAYLWERSTTGPVSGFAAAPGVNTGRNYQPPALTQNTWYRRQVTSGPCTSTSNVVAVTVRPTPVAAISGPATVCQDQTNVRMQFTNGHDLPIRITYNINGGPDLVQLVNANSTANVPVITSVPGTFVYSITNVRYQSVPNCSNTLSTPIMATVTVRPTPTATISGTTSVCQNAPSPVITFANPGTLPVRVTYKINGGSNQTIDINGGATATRTVSTTTAGVFTYALQSVRYTSGPGCDYTLTDAATVTVNPLPVPTISGPASVCLGSTHTYTTEPGMTGYNWTVSAGGAINSGQGSNTVSVTWSSSGSRTLRVTYTNTNGCTGTSPAYTVLVGLPPTGATITGPDVCEGTPVRFNVNITGGAPDYTIVIPEYSAAPISNYVSGTDIIPGVLPVGPHTFTLQSAKDLCGIDVPGLPKSITINVNPNPSVLPGTNPAVCRGSTSAVLPYSSPTGSPDRYSIDYSAAANTAGFVDVTDAVLPAGSITLSVPAAAPAAVYSGNLTVRNSITNCVSAVYPITVTINPIPAITPGANPAVCRGTTKAVLTYSSPSASPDRYSIDFNAAANSAGFADVTNAILQPGQIEIDVPAGAPPAAYNATLTVSNSSTGCVSAVYNIRVTVNPIPAIVPGANPAVCRGVTAANLPYNGATGSPNRYSIDYDTDANTAGFVDVVDASLPASPIVLTVPASAPAATYSAKLTVRNSTTGCVSAEYPITVTVNPIPSINPGANPSVCRGVTSADLAYSGATGNPDRYTIDFSAAAEGQGFADVVDQPLPAGIITVTIPPAAAPAVYNANLTVRNSITGCVSAVYPITVTVRPVPQLTSTLTPADVCSNVVFNYTPVSSVTGTSFSWERLPAAGITTTAPDNGTGSISQTLRNLTSATIPVTYRYTLTANSCSNVQDVVVNVKPEPVISDQSTGVCSGESLVWRILLDNFANPGDNVTFTWPAPALSGGLTGGTARSIPSSADMTDDFINITGLPETATYTVTPYYQGCIGETRDIVITIASQPVLDDLDMSACSNTPTGLVLRVASGSSAADSYDISSISVPTGLSAASGNASPANGIADINYLAGDRFTNETGVDQTVVYRIRPVLGTTCIGDWVDVRVTIRPQPVIVPGQKQTICSNTPASLEIKLLPLNIPAGSTFSWLAPAMSDGSVQGTAATGVAADPAGTHHITETFVNYGIAPITATYTVTPSSSHGCPGTPVNVVITVNPEPAAPVITGDDLLCTDQANVIYTVPGHPGSIYTWTVPASVGNKVFDVNSNAIIITAASVAGSGTITVTETNSYGCTGLAGSFSVNVMAPSMPANVAGDDEVCALETGTYSVPDHPGSVYTWTLPAGAALVGDPSAASITVTFGSVSGNIRVREVNAAGCVTIHNPLPVKVNPLPTAVISNSGTICAEDTHPVNITLTGTAPWTVVYAINGVSQPALNIASSPYTHMADAPGNYTILSVTDANGCTNIGTGNATVSYWPVPSAVISGSTAVCAGQSAVITVSLTGAAPYTFIYSNGATQTQVTNHPSPVYNFTVTPAADVVYTLVSMEDSHGCNGTVSGSAAVTIHAQPLLAFNVTNLQCYGDHSGAIDLAVTGSASNSYTWVGPEGFTAGTEDISGLGAGLYSVTVTSSDGCVATGQATVTQPPLLTLSSTGNISLLCNGDHSGAGSFTASGGTTPYTFTVVTNNTGASLTTNPTSVSFTGAGAGTITLRVTDANGCTALSTVTVSEPPALAITGTLKHISCWGGSDGTINTTVTGGTAPYFYAWTSSGGGSGVTAGAQNQGGLTAGTYEVTVTDAHGCQVTMSWTLTQPGDLILDVTADDNLIGTCSSAQLDVDVTGGVMPAGGYIYSWSPAAGLSATNIRNPVATPSSTTTYTVTVTDAQGCVKTASVTIAVAPVLTAVAYADDNMIGACPHQETQLHVNVNGGEAPYTFLWDNTGSLSDPADRDPFASPAANTTYIVIVTDANGCTATATVTVNVAPPLVVTASVDDNLIGTCPTSEARLSATVTGGEGPYHYSWDNPGSLSDPSVASPRAKPAVTTTYTITVTDANGCVATATVTVNVAPDLSVTASADDLLIGTCPGSVSSLEATPAGGEPDYTYKWTPATGLDDSNSRTPVAKPSVTTTYRVTITDANGCTAWDEITITVAPPLTLSLAVDDSSIGNCPGSEAHITSTVGGGEPGYTYSWSPAAGLSDPADPNPTATPNVTTTYTLTVTDQNNCTISRDITITVMPPLVVTASAVDPVIGTCPGSDTRLNAFATGGEPGYTYSWSPAAGLDNPLLQSPLAKPLSTTTYTVTVRDNNGCEATADVTVTVAPDLTVTATVDDNLIGTCPTSVAHLEATAAGGEPGYTYHWTPATGLSDPDSRTPTAKPASTTTYTVTVTDANGCQATASVTVNVADPLIVTVSADDYNIGTCPTSEAHLQAVVSGGEPGYTYLWSPATSLDDATIANPRAKPSVTTTYTVLVTDQNGCTATASLTITVAPELKATATASSPDIGTCISSTTTLDVIVTGGEPNYTFLWSPAAGLSDAGIRNPVAKPGTTTTYTVTVRDNNGCETTADVTVTVVPDLVVTATADDPVIGTCPISRSSLGVTVTGGKAPYSYAWSPAASLNNPNVSNPVAKPSITTTYTVTVTDAHGCVASDQITITVAPDLTVSAIADDYLIGTCIGSKSQISATASGGEPFPGGTYLWSWAPAAGLSATNIPNPEAKPTSTTTYTVTVTDANGCTATNTVTIEVAQPLAAIATASDYLIGDCPGSSTTLDVTVTGGELPYVYSWAPAATLNDASAKSPVATPAVTTTYTVTVTDANNCTVTADVTIHIAPPLVATAAVDDDPIGTCPTSRAHLSTTVTGGEGAYTYLWDNALHLDDAHKANPVAKPPVSTLFTVTVRDANHCTTTAQVWVNVAPDLSVAITADDDLIGTCPGSVANLTATGMGGEPLPSGGYLYNWSPAAGLNYTNVQSPVAKPAVTTTYTVIITDANGCTATDQVTIRVADPLVLSATPVVYAGGYNITCNGASDGAIDLGVTGGEAPYTYAWSGPAGYTSSSEDISGLIAGSYTVTVTDANNCTAVTNVVLLEPAPLTLGKTPDVVLACYGDATAAGSFSVSGGTAPYLLSDMSNTAGATLTITGTSLSFTGGAAGVVTARVTDANGCTAHATITITQPPQLMPGSIDGDQEVCYLGDPTPLHEVTAPSGGPAPALFQWERSLNGGASWSIIPGANMASYDPPAGIAQTTHFRRRVNSASCDPEYSNVVVVTVNPLPVASIDGTGFVCPGDAATLTVTVTTGVAPFTVVLTDGTTVTGYNSGDPITVNPLVTTTYAIASLTDSKGCTVAAPHANLTGSATITIKGVPEIVLQPVSVSVCEDDPATFTVDAGVTTNPHYQWFVDTGSGMTALTGATGATLTVTAASAMNGYRYQAEISGDCPHPVLSDIVTLTVSEKPEIVTQPVNLSVCAGEDAHFTVDAGVTTNPRYQWYVNTGSGWNPVVGARYQGATTATLTVVSALEIMSGYEYRVRVSGDCAPYVESVPVMLTVTRQAEITQHPVSLTLCEGQPATFTVNAGLTTGPSFQWERSDDGGATWTAIPGATTAAYTIAAVASADNNTAYRAVVHSTCGSSVTSLPAFLTVNELPEIVDQPADVTLCEYAIAEFTVDAGVTTAATYRWQRSTDGGANWNNLSETSTYFGTMTANLKVNGTRRTMNGDMFRVIVSGTCTPPVTSHPALLTVNTPPEIVTQPDGTVICENNPTSFSVTAQGTALTYQWYVDRRDGSGFTAVTDGGVYSGAEAATLTLSNVPRSYNGYRYRVEIEGTCAPKAVSFTVQLDVNIVTAINTQPADVEVCEFMTTSFTAQAEGANLRYQWQAWDGTVWDDLTNTGVYLGVQTPTLMIFGPPRTMDGTRYRVVISGDCSPDLISHEAVLTVNTAPELIDHPDEFRGCPGGSATFTAAAVGTAITYQWQVNSGSGFHNVTDGGNYSGTKTPVLTISNLGLSMNGHLVRVVVSGTCQPPVTSSFAPLRVYMEPSVIREPADAEVCDETGVVFFSQVFNTGAGETTVWQVNDGSGWNDLSDDALYQGTQTPQLVIMKAVTAMNGWRYRLEITGPCGNYYTREALLTVNALPTAQIAPADTLLVCGGVPTQLHGNPAGGSLSYAAHRWFGDIGPLSRYNIENPMFNTSMAGFYRLIYQVTDSKGCTGLDTLVIEVEKPVAMFTVDQPSGCPPLTAGFTNGSTGYTSLLWNFGDGVTSTVENPSHTYANPGASLAYYTVRLTVTSANGCVSYMENNITVYPEVGSDFAVSNDTICSGESIMFSTLPGAFRYYWDYGDGFQESGSNVISHTYFNTTTGPVTRMVTLKTESFFGCTSETTLPVVVYPTPVPGFIATPASQVFPDATVSFTNTTNSGTWTWLWNFDDGYNSPEYQPTHTYNAPGDYNVRLTVSNGVCTEQVVHTVRVLPTPPIARFDSIPSGCQPWNVAINNTSLYGTSYYWDFGDGHTSSARNPNYTYVQAGVYQVTLTVTGPGGIATAMQVVHVYPSPRAYFDISPPKVYVNDEEIRLFNLSDGGSTFIWEFGDGDTSHVRDPHHKYTKEGIYDITLHAYSANGCYDTYVKSPGVTVEPFGDLIFASVFKPNPEGPIDIDGLPTGGESMDQFFFPPIRETVLEYHLQIFNRWGVLIFETRDINKPWNGYYKGQLCQQGVYVWLVEGKYANGRPFKKAGDITLLH